MPRAPKKCGHLTCTTRVTGTTYCPEHTPTWRTTTRRSRLPADWPQRRAAVEQRAGGRCEADTRLGVAHVPTCSGLGSECDHITPGDNHDLSNLCWLSSPCHKAKTSRENAARNRQRARR